MQVSWLWAFCSCQLQASISISSMIFFQKSRLLDDAAVQAKLKATKTKLQACYQQAENGLYSTTVFWLFRFVNYSFSLLHEHWIFLFICSAPAKMQWKTKFVDLHELPKQRLRRKKTIFETLDLFQAFDKWKALTTSSCGIGHIIFFSFFSRQCKSIMEQNM